MDPHTAGRTARMLEPLHALGYFAREVDDEVSALGVRRGRATYFASRAAPMGRVGAGPVAATFYVFNPSLVAHFIPSAWESASPDEVVAARYRGVSAAWARLLGEEVLASDEVKEAADLARAAAGGCSVAGRPLHAAHADLPWPVEPHMALFHAITLLREHRGDGHVAALVGSDLSGIDALVTHTATGRGFTRAAAQSTRAWSDDEWAASVAGLAERGLMTSAGELTEEGTALRRTVEHRTEESAFAPWQALGESGTQRLTELCRPLVTTALANGAFPEGVFA
ncbi:hypothetical protein SAMN04489844_1556 [Nocardioides exalbidus]|uniref:SalK n=1 Tax=Nocardioides exalbidus TaxID=402596 RepID=A0A1H4P8Y6_9ACTN|nr:hypothetical protein [Nocardioides exalbidus]SEC03923.1 hypothetical protein SAMN04489844_1556 [Nocardioides exalbidus]